MKLSTLFIVVMLSCHAYSEPLIAEVVGELGEGDTLILKGIGFGEHSLKYSWLGGRTGYIESGIIGQAASDWPYGWSRVNNDWPDPVFDSSESHSGEQCILLHDAVGDKYWTAETISFHLPSSQRKVYVTFWAKLRILQGNFGQWKVLRISPDSDVSDAQSGEWDFLFNRVSGSTYRGMQCEDSGGDWPDGYPGDNYNLRYLSNYGGVSIKSDTWQRFEIELTHNSAPGAEDGRLVIRSQDGANDPRESTENTAWETRCDASDALTNYVTWQNYGGNGIEGEDIWLDDMYVQWDTIARIELCERSAWASRGRCEIQPVQNWSDGSVKITLNKGAFGTEPAYLYVVDSTGRANEQGFLISLDAESHAVHPADTNDDSCIQQAELMDYIEDWQVGDVSIGSLMACVSLWKEGCG